MESLKIHLKTIAFILSFVIFFVILLKLPKHMLNYVVISIALIASIFLYWMIYKIIKL